mmetsp:Transcript_21007/g.52108  ORF Transcript_21007/g.52108 Transcript_21007/m.52108 type:complete len:100 (+) Transcript_21007:384-683(+)
MSLSENMTTSSTTCPKFPWTQQGIPPNDDDCPTVATLAQRRFRMSRTTTMVIGYKGSKTPSEPVPRSEMRRSSKKMFNRGFWNLIGHSSNNLYHYNTIE